SRSTTTPNPKKRTQRRPRSRPRRARRPQAWRQSEGRTSSNRPSLEGSADQDLLRRACVGKRAVDADVVVGDAEAAQVVGRHGSGARAQGDRSNGAEVERHPEDGAIWEVDVLDLD